MAKRPPGQPLWPLPPIRGESLLGWGMRTAHHNVLPSCFTLLRAAGNDYKDLPNGALGRVQHAPDLARVFAAEVGEVTSRMLLPSQHQGFVLLGGVAVRRIALVTDKRRFSPSSVAASAHHRQAWMFRILPFCAESWEYLRDDCASCGRVQGWLHAHDARRCDRCGSDLTDQPAENVAPELRASLAELHSLVTGYASDQDPPRPTSPALAGLEPGALLDLVCTLAGLIDPQVPHWLGARVDMDHHRRLASAMAHAWGLLDEYPASVLDGLWDAGRNEAGRRQQRFTRRLSGALRGDDRLSALPGTRDALERLRDLITGGQADRRNVLVKPAARMLRTTEGEVARARDSGDMIVRYGMSNGRVLYGLDKDEVEHLAEVRRTTLSPFATGRRLFLPGYAVDQLVDLKLLEANDHPWIVRLHGRPQITEGTLAKLLDRVLSNSVPACDIERPTCLARLMRGYGGGPKPWGEVFRRMLDGEMPYAIHASSMGVRGILVSADEARGMWTTPPAEALPTYLQFDALDILNHALKKGADLRPFRIDDALEHSWSVEGRRIARIAAERMSFAELVVRTGLEVATAQKAILLRGVDKPTRFGWDREQLLDRASDLLWSPRFIRRT